MMGQIGTALADYGIDFTALSDAETNGRPYGTLNPLALMFHHTASENTSLTTIRRGRADLPGPLSQLFLEEYPQRKLWLVSEGVCNHAGSGSPATLANVRADNPVVPLPGMDASAGVSYNTVYIGIEVEGDSWDDFAGTPRYWLAVKVGAAICEHYDWDPLTRIISHKEHTLRKPDPFWDMPQFRKDVVAELDSFTSPVLPVYDPPSSWAAPAWAKAEAHEPPVVTVHSDPHKTVTKEELVVMFDRLGLLEDST